MPLPSPAAPQRGVLVAAAGVVAALLAVPPTAAAAGSAPPSPAPPAAALPPPSGGLLTPVTPARLLDTRDGSGPVRAGSPRELGVTGVGGVPADGVAAVVLNVTVTGGSTRGDLQVFPVGLRPERRTSNVNWAAGETVPVQVQTAVGRGGRVGLSVSAGTAHVVVDVFGWYSTAGSGGAGLTGLTPERVLDTRESSPLVAGTPLDLPLAGRAGVPEGATAVLLNATALGASTSTDLSFWPTGEQPARRTSNLNLRPGDTVANAVLVPLSSSGRATVSSSAGAVEVVLDVLGAFVPGSGGRFVALPPTRLVDTRPDRAPVRAGTPSTFRVADRAGVPANADAVALGVVGTAATTPADLQVRPAGSAPEQRTSTLNLQRGEAVPNLAAARLGDDGAVELTVSAGEVHAVLDVFGYWTAADASVCSSAERGWTARWPADWTTGPGAVVPSCGLFDPEPIVLQEGTEVPLALAVHLRRADLTVEQALDSDGRREESRRRATVDGRPAHRVEWVQTRGTIIPEGMRYTQWLVDVGEQTVIGTAFDTGSFDTEPSYASRVQVLDAVLASLDLTEPPSPPFSADAEPESRDPGSGARLSVADVRTGAHEGYDRVVLDLGGSGTPGWTVRWQDQPRRQGSGEPVALQGDATLEVVVRGVALPGDTSGEQYSGPETFATPGLGTVREVLVGGTYEGRHQVFLGASARTAFRVFALEDPARVVVDVVTP